MKKQTIAKYVGAKIKERRIAQGIGQEELGTLLKLSRVSILNMEAGKHRPSIDNIFLLCGIFKCNVNDLFPPIKAVDVVFEEKNVRVTKKVMKIKLIRR